MKYTIQFLAITFLALATSSCHKVIGDGPMTSETRRHSGFSALSSSVDATVIYTQGSDYYVEIDAQQNIIDRLKSDVSGGELRFYYPDRFDIGRHDPITIYVTAPNVSGFTQNGSGEIRSSDIEADNKTVRLTNSGSGAIYFTAIYSGSVESTVVGSGRINVAGGTTRTVSTDISGSGTIDLNNLRAERVSTHTAGSGTTSVYATSTLDVHISGSGTVYYRGTPSITTDISGSGNLRHY